MNKLYLKEPYKEHKDLTVPVTILKMPNSPTDEYIVYSSIICNTFPIGLNDVKGTPVDSEYVVDIKEASKQQIKLGLEPAFAIPAHTDVGDKPGYGRASNSHFHQEGISKRFYAACAAMQGIFASWVPHSMPEEKGIKETVDVAWRAADELIKQEYENLDNKVE